MPKNPGTEANPSVSKMDDANNNSQKARLPAIQPFKWDLMVKIKEKAPAQLAVLQSQFDQFQTELLSVVEKVDKRVEAGESQRPEAS